MFEKNGFPNSASVTRAPPRLRVITPLPYRLLCLRLVTGCLSSCALFLNAKSFQLSVRPDVATGLLSDTCDVQMQMCHLPLPQPNPPFLSGTPSALQPLWSIGYPPQGLHISSGLLIIEALAQMSPRPLQPTPSPGWGCQLFTALTTI